MKTGCRNCGRKKGIGVRIYCSKQCQVEDMSRRFIARYKKKKLSTDK